MGGRKFLGPGVGFGECICGLLLTRRIVANALTSSFSIAGVGAGCGFGIGWGFGGAPSFTFLRCHGKGDAQLAGNVFLNKTSLVCRRANRLHGIGSRRVGPAVLFYLTQKHLVHNPFTNPSAAKGLPLAGTMQEADAG